MKVFTLFAFLLVGCSLPVMRADSATCEVDADCTVVTPCCSCCAEVAMTVVVAAAGFKSLGDDCKLNVVRQGPVANLINVLRV